MCRAPQRTRMSHRVKRARVLCELPGQPAARGSSCEVPEAESWIHVAVIGLSPEACPPRRVVGLLYTSHWCNACRQPAGVRQDAAPVQPELPAVADVAPQFVYVFAYGGNMCCETLTRRGVRVVGRDPAFVSAPEVHALGSSAGAILHVRCGHPRPPCTQVTDPSIRMVFKHKGGRALQLFDPLPTAAAPHHDPTPTTNCHM
jgi:hypothetical protein